MKEIKLFFDEFNYRSIIDSAPELKELKTLPFEESFKAGDYFFVYNPDQSIEVGIGKRTKLNRLICIRFLEKKCNEILPEPLKPFAIGSVFDYKKSIEVLGKFSKLGQKLIFNSEFFFIAFELSGRQVVQAIEITDKEGVQLNLRNQAELKKFNELKEVEGTKNIKSILNGSWKFSEQLTEHELTQNNYGDVSYFADCCSLAENCQILTFNDSNLVVKENDQTVEIPLKICKVFKDGSFNIKVLNNRRELIDFGKYSLKEGLLLSYYYPGHLLVYNRIT